VLQTFAANLPRLRALLVDTLARLPESQDGCTCADTSGHPASFVLP
jgi:hypothetical protein